MTEKKEKPESMNAFEFISRSQGLNLGNLFEQEMVCLQRPIPFELKHIIKIKCYF